MTGDRSPGPENRGPEIQVDMRADDETIAIFPVDLADDVVIHLISGVPGLSGTYQGRDRVTTLVKSLSEAVHGQLGYELLHIWPVDPEPSDELVLSVARLTIGSDAAERKYTQVGVGRRVNERVVEAWLISSSVGDALVGEAINVETPQ